MTEAAKYHLPLYLPTATLSRAMEIQQPSPAHAHTSAHAIDYKERHPVSLQHGISSQASDGLETEAAVSQPNRNKGKGRATEDEARMQEEA